MPNLYGFGVRVFGCCNIQVTSSSREAYTTLERYVFPTLPRVIGFAKQPDLVIRVDRAGSQFHLLVNDNVVASARDVIELVPDVIRVLDDAVIPRLTSFRAVHAGTILWRGEALLLPGVSHAGKSSLVAAMLRRGATYFSDEYALIDREGRVHPYPRPLLVRNGRPEQVPVLAGQYNALTGDAPARIGWILALKYVPTCTWSVASVSQSEALMMLLQNTPH